MLAHVVVLMAAACCGALASPVEYPGALYSQYHAQDELGQYTFGYSGPAAAKHETRTADGVTRGTYSYVDPNGQLQTRTYTADDVNGFRVAASDLPVGPSSASYPYSSVELPPPSWQNAAAPYRYTPLSPASLARPVQDTPEVAAAKAQHLAAVEAAKRRNGVASDSSAQYFGSSASYPLEHRYLSAPSLAPYNYQSGAPLVTLPTGISSQYHAQDELGQYSFGYANDISSKSETKTLDGVTRGSYSYLDPNGLMQTRSYIADAGGFRVAASDLPQVTY
ncbi:Cuticle protein 6 [Frankliniella fusca]|uniref:Cuticle protein 6 n=1 Tax=Frankliniella fusca TaxID=407009 RepID=A0AAE1H548_9NEOP|nr:Cuticle protein 6 [Frankliniella fusca]